MTAQVNNQMSNAGMGAAAKTKVAPKDFLKNFSVLPEKRFRTTESGLKVAVVREGKGEPAVKGMKLKVHYTGWLGVGEKFDSSQNRGKPFELTLGVGQVIKGWEEGLLGMKPGERRQLIIPAELAYGERSVGKIPPGSTLIFNVELAENQAPRTANGKTAVVA